MQSRTEIIAHRGASSLVKFENTIEAFQKAIDIGAKIMEFDIRRTKDGQLVSFHDATIEGKRLSSLTYKEILAISSKKGYEVPLVKDICILSEGKIKLDIELKETGYEKQVIDLVQTYLAYEDYMMKSFLDICVKRIKEIDPKIKAGLLVGIAYADATPWIRYTEIFPELRMRRCKADFISPHYKLLKFFFVQRMHFAKKEVYVWTVNDKKTMQRLIEQGIDGIITDRPDVALKQLEEYKKKMEKD